MQTFSWLVFKRVHCRQLARLECPSTNVFNGYLCIHFKFKSVLFSNFVFEFLKNWTWIARMQLESKTSSERIRCVFNIKKKILLTCARRGWPRSFSSTPSQRPIACTLSATMWISLGNLNLFIKMKTYVAARVSVSCFDDLQVSHPKQIRERFNAKWISNEGCALVCKLDGSPFFLFYKWIS